MENLDWPPKGSLVIYFQVQNVSVVYVLYGYLYM